MHGSGQPAQQIRRQGDPDPVPTLLPAGVQLLGCALAGPLSGPAHLQVLLYTHLDVLSYTLSGPAHLQVLLYVSRCTVPHTVWPYTSTGTLMHTSRCTVIHTVWPGTSTGTVIHTSRCTVIHTVLPYTSTDTFLHTMNLHISRYCYTNCLALQIYQEEHDICSLAHSLTRSDV